MYKSFDALREMMNMDDKKVIAVAAAEDKEVLATVKQVQLEGVADFVLVGNRNEIEGYLSQMGIEVNVNIIHEEDKEKACKLAIQLINEKKANVLMKGLVNSGMFLKTVLHESIDHKNRFLSHLAAFQIPNQKKLVFYTDGGMNEFPDYEAKIKIVKNGIQALRRLGIEEPKIAVLTANESITPSMPATVDALNLAKAAQEGTFGKCILEGPIALDVAASQNAARHKGIDSKISGDVDLFIVPNIEAGNMIGKALMYYADAKMAGIVVGASFPIVMTSRAENVEGKRNSILLSCLVS